MIDAYRAAQPVDRVQEFLTEQARIEHIHHDQIARQLAKLRNTAGAAWAIQSAARELEHCEVIERWLAGKLREVPG